MFSGCALGDTRQGSALDELMDGDALGAGERSEARNFIV